MLIAVEHTTSFTYAESISEAYTELRVRPLSGGGQQPLPVLDSITAHRPRLLRCEGCSHVLTLPDAERQPPDQVLR